MDGQGLEIPVPSPDQVRDLLARNLHENRILRSLLRVSERAAEVRQLHESASSRRDRAGGAGR